MSLGEELRRNTLWVLSGQSGGRILGFAFGVVLARLLTPEDFGLVVTVQILAGALSFLAAHGTADALVRATSISDRDVGTAFSLQLIACVVIFLALNAIAPWFALWFKDPRLESLLQISAIGFLLRPLMSIPQALLQRAKRFREISIWMLVGGAVSGAASTAFAIAGYGPWALIMGGLVGAVVRSVLLMREAAWVPRVAFDPTAARTLGTFGLKLSVNEILQYARNQTANALISRQLGAGPVGLYNKGASLAEIPADLLGGSAHETLFRTLASIRDDRGHCARLFLKSLTLVLFYTLPFYVGLAWVAEPFITTLYGSHWSAAALPLQILTLTGVFQVVTTLSRAVAASHDLLGREIRIQLETWAVLVLGIVAGLNWGLVGVALGVLPGVLYNALRLYLLAGAALGLGLMDLARALIPVVLLNAALALGLAGTHWVLGGLGWVQHPVLYLALMVGSGGLLYAGLFLSIPPRSLKVESGRWRGRLSAMLARKARRNPPKM